MRRILATMLLLGAGPTASAQQSMNMVGMENTAGYLSSGTSLEPKATSESSTMVHMTLGNWALMFHGNAFVVSTQQSGPRGGDKVFSGNWAMPMIARSFGASAIALRTMRSACGSHRARTDSSTVAWAICPMIAPTTEKRMSEVVAKESVLSTPAELHQPRQITTAMASGPRTPA